MLNMCWWASETLAHSYPIHSRNCVKASLLQRFIWCVGRSTSRVRLSAHLAVGPLEPVCPYVLGALRQGADAHHRIARLHWPRSLFCLCCRSHRSSNSPQRQHSGCTVVMPGGRARPGTLPRAQRSIGLCQPLEVSFTGPTWRLRVCRGAPFKGPGRAAQDACKP